MEVFFMSRELIENGVIIDETEGILEGLNEVSKTKKFRFISNLQVYQGRKKYKILYR